MVKRIQAFTVVALLTGGIAAAPAQTDTDVDRNFDALSSLRVTQDVTSGPHAFEAKFYSGYETGRVTISNKSGESVRFSSYEGFVAVVRPGDIFGVPCNDRSIAGRLSVLDGTENVAVDEQALCGDLVLIDTEEGDAR